jgi:hypothetical protein
MLPALALGASTIPLQLDALAAALAPTGAAAADVHYAAMRAGLTRMILADRLVPAPTLLLAGLGVALLSEPVLAVARSRRAALGTVVLLGLSPLLVLKTGELALTLLGHLDARPSPGEVMSLPGRFETGVLVLWRAADPPPRWLEVLDARVNLVSLWCLGLWTVALRVLDGGGLKPWHLLAPAAALIVAGTATWIVAPLVFSMLLGPS